MDVRVARVAWFVLAASAAAAGCSRSAAAPAESRTADAAVAVAPVASVRSEAKAFGAACFEDAECAGAVCFHKRLKGPDAGKERRGMNDPVERDGYCSMRCDDDADCPVPLTRGRCGARGMCKRAD